MFYEHRTDLPEALQRTMPVEAQEMYRETYNTTWNRYEHSYEDIDALSAEELAHRMAWGKIKRHFSKDCQGQWRIKPEPLASKEEPHED